MQDTETSTDHANGGGQTIAAESHNVTWITAVHAQKKHGLSNGLIYQWASKGQVRREGPLFAEEDIVARMATYKRQPSRGPKPPKRAKTGPLEKSTQPAPRISGPGPDLSHHVAYLSGYTDSQLDHYARNNGLDPLALRAGLAEVLRTRS